MISMMLEKLMEESSHGKLENVGELKKLINWN